MLGIVLTLQVLGPCSILKMENKTHQVAVAADIPAHIENGLQ